MKGTFYTQGTFYTLEAALSVIMIITSLIFIFKFSTPALDLSTANYKKEAYNALGIVDGSGELRSSVLANNVTAIEGSLDPYIAHSFDVAIFNKTSNLTTIPELGTENVVSVSYIISGEVGNYTPREVRVYVWGAG
jgi:hypothetical protein